MKKSFLILFAVALMASAAVAQNSSKSDVLTVKRRSLGTIMQEGQVKGYYYFYTIDKKDRKNNNYALSVVDENLREINSVPIVRPNTYYLIDAAFNGEAFAFLFYDAREKSLELMGYDRTLKATGKVKKDVSNKFVNMMYAYVAAGNEPMQAYLLAGSNKGFVYYGAKAESKGEYEIEFYDNSLKKAWATTAPAKDDYDFEYASEAFVDGGYIGTMTAKRKGIMSTDMVIEFLVQSMADGKQLFKIPLETPKYSFALSQAFFDNAKQQFIVFGEYYNKGDNVMKNQSLGFISVVLDLKGKIVTEKVSSWKTDIARQVPEKDKAKFEDTSVLFHDFIRTSDGHIFAVGEQYRKGGIPMAIKLNVYDMVIFEFDQDFVLQRVQTFEKDKNSVDMPRGFALTSLKVLSYYAKSIGGFDYVFSYSSKDNSTFMVGYINYDREKGEKAKNVLGSIVYTPEKTFAVDKMDLNRKSSAYFVLQAKEGYVMVSEYFEKERRVDNRLEKVNF